MAANYLVRSSDLIDQVLKIDPRNEKGLMRKLTILVEMGDKKKYEEYLSKLEDVAFQS